MAINETLLKLDGWTVPNVKKYIVERPKLWTNASRNMAGGLRATLIGVFAKINVTIAYLTENDLQTLISKLDQPSIQVTYYDAKTKTVKTGTFYASDYKLELFRKDKGLYRDINFRLIPYNKDS